MKTILVPIDFSKNSISAVKLASKVSTLTNANVHLLHSVEMPTGIIDMGAGSDFNFPQSIAYIKRVKQNIENIKSSYFNNKNVESTVVFNNNPYQSIKEYNQEHNPSLIIMGAKGVSDFEEIIIGSNAEKTVRTSEAPVIVVKEEIENLKIENIVFATDFEKESLPVFRKVLDFAGIFKAKVHLIKVNTLEDFESTAESNKKLNEYISNINDTHFTTTIYNDHSVSEGILNYASALETDLLALSTHQRNGLTSFFNSSVASSLSKKTNLPIITFKI